MTPAGVDQLVRWQGQRPAPVLQLARLRRFLVDEALFALCPTMSRPLLDDAFELTLSDGAQMKRCVLATELNHLVYSGALDVLQLVRVDAVSYRHEAAAGADAPALVFLTSIAPLSAPWPDEVCRRAAGVPPALLGEERPPTLPLGGFRRYFLELDCNQLEHEPPRPAADASGAAPAAAADADADADEANEMCVDDWGEPAEGLALEARLAPTLAAALEWQARQRAAATTAASGRGRSSRGRGHGRGGRGSRGGLASVQPALVGRIVRMSALSHFGKPTDPESKGANATFPFKLELAISDWSLGAEGAVRADGGGDADDGGSGFASPENAGSADAPDGRAAPSSAAHLELALWNQAASAQGLRLRPGNAVVVDGYRIKMRAPAAGAAAEGGGGRSWECAVNHTNPAGRVRVLSEAELARHSSTLGVRLALPPRPPALAASELAASRAPPRAGQRVSVFGLLAAVSAPLRVAVSWAEGGQGVLEPKAFALGRWLTLVAPLWRTAADADPSSPRALRVWLEASAAAELFEAVDAQARGSPRSPLGAVVCVHEVEVVDLPCALAAAARDAAAADDDDPAARVVAFARGSQHARATTRAALPDDSRVLELVALARDEPRAARALCLQHAARLAACTRAAAVPAPSAWVCGNVPRAGPGGAAARAAETRGLLRVALAQPLAEDAQAGGGGGARSPFLALAAVPAVEASLHVRQQRTIAVVARVLALEAGADGCARLELGAPHAEAVAGLGASAAPGTTAAPGTLSVRVPLLGDGSGDGGSGAGALDGLRALFGLAQGQRLLPDAVDDDISDAAARCGSLEAACAQVAECVLGRLGEFVVDLYRDETQQVTRALGCAFLALARSAA
jgi:hypothetical protein